MLAGNDVTAVRRAGASVKGSSFPPAALRSLRPWRVQAPLHDVGTGCWCRQFCWNTQTHKTADERTEQGVNVGGWWRVMTVTFLRGGREQKSQRASGRSSLGDGLLWRIPPKPAWPSFLIIKA